MSTYKESVMIVYFISVYEVSTMMGMMSPKLSLDMIDVFLKVII